MKSTISSLAAVLLLIAGAAASGLPPRRTPRSMTAWSP